ncbi:IS110 family transposase [Permianibacter aggregans]|uniref:Transposase n=1 Tax=Permianibacter aggregans TaxID=1510150 RepID=A0A4R6UAA2_9GAMM|nr:IS110 family transposase [Permianibacter aggregans]QGX40923.1 IS110 family transposase [Permianibacter aggregans]TDQ41963.1 transposase [Permianibacter aggregans]
MKINRMGIDLAKSVFQLHGVDENEQVVVRRQLKRSQMQGYFHRQQPMLIGMEACGSAHYWARTLTAMGHTVKLIAPQHVKPYVKSNKNDRNDAEAICEAVSRPTMRFVAVKTIEQQDMQSIHRVRERLVKARNALTNEVRGLLAEYGIVISALGVSAVSKALPTIVSDAENGLSRKMRELLHGMYEELDALKKRIKQFDQQIQQHSQEDERVHRLMQIDGVGPITASAIVTAVGDAKQFRSGREMAAWLGIVPKQHSSGGRERLGGISKRGDKRLRTLVIHGARSVIKMSEKKDDRRSQWVNALAKRRNKNIATVALGNKNVRIMYAMLTRNVEYQRAA